LYLENLGSPYITEWDEAVQVNVVQNLAAHCCQPYLHRSAALAGLNGAPAVSGFESLRHQERQLRLGTDYRDWTNNTVWLHKPLLPFYFAAATFKLAGGSLWGLRLSGAIFALLNAAVVYLIGRRFLSNTVGLFALAIFGLNPYVDQLVHGQTFSGFPDLALSCAVSAAMYCVLHWTRYRSTAALRWLGVAVAIGYLSKGGLALGPFAIFAVITILAGTYRDFLPILQSLGIFATLVIPVQLYWRARQPVVISYESRMQMLHLFQVIEGHRGPWVHYIAAFLPAMLTLPLIPIAYFSVGWALFHFKRTDTEFILGIWILVYLIPLSFAANKIDNFIFALLPAFALLAPRVLESLFRNRRFDLIVALCFTSLAMFFVMRIGRNLAHPGAFGLLVAAPVLFVAVVLLSRWKPASEVLTLSVLAFTGGALLLLYVHRDVYDNTAKAPDFAAQAALRDTGLILRPLVGENSLIIAHNQPVDLSYLYLMYWSGADVLDICREPDPFLALWALRNTNGLYLLTVRQLPEGPLAKTPTGALYSLKNLPYQDWSKTAASDCPAR